MSLYSRAMFVAGGILAASTVGLLVGGHWISATGMAFVAVVGVAAARRQDAGSSTPAILPDDLARRISALLAQGKTVDAVALARQETGLSLLEAKRAVDQLGLG